MKRKHFKEVDGEVETVEVEVFPYCSCLSASGYDLVKVEVAKDEEGIDTCKYCGSYVVWTNQEEISNNARR